jgi:transglutaminase-like putative cysteine protease
MQVSLRFAVLATLGVVVLGSMSARFALAQREEVEDTVVADEDTRPLFERKPAASEDRDKGAPTPTRRLRAPVKNRYSIADPALELADPRTYRLRVMVRISAPEATVNNIAATCPIPMEWPEQKVRLLSEQASPGARITETVLPGQAAMLKFQVSKIEKGDSASIERMYEITRYRTKFTLPADELVMPKSPPPELREQLIGIPPGVEIQNQKMIDLANTLNTATRDAGAWENVKSFWSWTRDNVKFENGDFRGAMHALDQHCGDCEEMSALFVGLCRLSKIPARTVWVHSHDYPEFYLVDKQGKGHWIPAQVLGPAWFGEMAEYRPIFQKGDRFYDPLKKEYVRYVPQTVRGGGDAKVLPQVEFQHEIIADSDINGPGYGSGGATPPSIASPTP